MGGWGDDKMGDLTKGGCSVGVSRACNQDDWSAAFYLPDLVRRRREQYVWRSAGSHKAWAPSTAISPLHGWQSVGKEAEERIVRALDKRSF